MVRQSAHTYYFLWHSEVLIGAMCTKNKQHLIQEQHYFFIIINSKYRNEKKNVSVKWLHIKAAGDNYL